MEPKRDRRKVWWAVLASVVLHLILGLALAAFASKASRLAPLEEEAPPVQMTDMVLLPNTSPLPPVAMTTASARK